MKQTGIVIAVDEQTQRCTVQIQRQNACAGCHAPCRDGDGCSMGFVSAPPITLTIENSLSKQVGACVTIATRSAKVIFLMAVLYLLPAIFAIVAYCLCDRWFGSRVAMVAFFVVLAVFFGAAVAVCTKICQCMIRYEMIG